MSQTSFDKTIEAINKGNCSVGKISVFFGTPNKIRYSRSIGELPFDRFFHINRGSFSLINKSGTKISAGAGNIIYLPADVEYESYWEKPEEGEYILFGFTLLNDIGQRISFSNEAILILKDKNAGLNNSFSDAYKKYTEYGLYANIELQSDFFHILYTILRLREKNSLKHGDSSKEIYKAMLYLNNNYTSDITSEKLASMCNLSPTTFRVLFKKYNNASPIKYKNHLRMNHAKEMLSSGLYTVSEVSEIVNCYDLAHFSKLYKNEFGVNPSQDIPKSVEKYK